MQAYATSEIRPTPQLHLVDSSSPAYETPNVDGGAVVEWLAGQIAKLVADRVAARLVAPGREPKDEWLDTRRAAEHLGISRDSVRRLAAEGSIATEQAGVGCKLYFRRSELDQWRCSGSAPAVALGSVRHG